MEKAEHPLIASWISMD